MLYIRPMFEMKQSNFENIVLSKSESIINKQVTKLSTHLLALVGSLKDTFL